MTTIETIKPRHFSRIHFDAVVQVHFHLVEEAQTAHLLDISLKGALVETAQPILNTFNGKICRMVLFLGKGEKITMEGRVVHHQDLLIGIECLHIDVDSMINLRRLVELNMVDEKLLERELAEVIKIDAINPQSRL